MRAVLLQGFEQSLDKQCSHLPVYIKAQANFLINCSAFMDSIHTRLQKLRDECKARISSWEFRYGIQGLTLNLDFLKTKGANESFLKQWRNGVSLQAETATTRYFRNHPSVTTHDQWAEAEWGRLEKLGKVTFLSGTSRRHF